MKLETWDTTQYLNIGALSDLFSIPTSTLRFWEKKGLIKADRIISNNYRIYDYQTILKLTDLIHMKNMGMSLENMKKYPIMNLGQLEDLYSTHEDMLLETIKHYEEVHKRVTETRRLIQEFNMLTVSEEITISDPDIMQIIPHNRIDDKEVWKKYFSGQYQFGAIIFEKDKGEAWGWIPSSIEEDTEAIWEYKEGEKEYALFALWVDVYDRSKNNLKELSYKCLNMGFTPGITVARYICTALEGDSRKDCYKAWVEIKKNNL